MRLCPAPGCRTPITPKQRRCAQHDQRHAYRNTGRTPAVGYSVVLFAGPGA